MHKEQSFLFLVLLLGLIVFSPCTTRAQTGQSIEEQLRTKQGTLQQEFSDYVQEQINLIPTPEEIRTNTIRDYLQITATPSNPKPEERVKISIQSYLVDVNKATIAWFVDGKKQKEGIGEKTFTFTNGRAGVSTRILMQITLNTGEVIVKTLTFNPVNVILLWEAETRTPSFYKGKALATPQAEVRVVAIQDGEKIPNGSLDAKKLSYVWEKNGARSPDSSGYGKNVFSFTSPLPSEPMRLRVRASSLDDSISSEIKIEIPMVAPFVEFYENNPLLGIWYNKPFGSKITLKKEEVSFVAEPFFFSPDPIGTSEFLYYWTINGKKVASLEELMTLRNEKGETGTSLVKLVIQGTRKTFQSFEKKLTILLEPPEGSKPIF